MVGSIIGLVLAHRNATAGQLASDCEHRFGYTPLRDAGGLAEHPCHCQSVAVLHGDMPHVGQLRLATRCLAIQPAVRIGGALVRVVLPGLTVEVRAITVTAILRAEAAL